MIELILGAIIALVSFAIGHARGQKVAVHPAVLVSPIETELKPQWYGPLAAGVTPAKAPKEEKDEAKTA